MCSQTEVLVVVMLVCVHVCARPCVLVHVLPCVYVCVYVYALGRVLPALNHLHKDGFLLPSGQISEFVSVCVQRRGT